MRRAITDNVIFLCRRGDETMLTRQQCQTRNFNANNDRHNNDVAMSPNNVASRRITV